MLFMASIARVREKGAICAECRNWCVTYESGYVRTYKHTYFYDLPYTLRSFICNAECDMQFSGYDDVVRTYTAAAEGDDR